MAVQAATAGACGARRVSCNAKRGPKSANNRPRISLLRPSLQRATPVLRGNVAALTIAPAARGGAPAARRVCAAPAPRWSPNISGAAWGRCSRGCGNATAGIEERPGFSRHDPNAERVRQHHALREERAQQTLASVADVVLRTGAIHNPIDEDRRGRAPAACAPGHPDLSARQFHVENTTGVND